MQIRFDIVARRKVWAWLCIAAWLVLVLGPAIHGFGHENDHVHVHGTVVHTHELEPDDSPADLIASARAESDDDSKPDKPQKRDDNHGFDVDAHFVGSTVPAPFVLDLLENLEPPETSSFPAALQHQATPTGISLARGPPTA